MSGSVLNLSTIASFLPPPSRRRYPMPLRLKACMRIASDSFHAEKTRHLAEGSVLFDETERERGSAESSAD